MTDTTGKPGAAAKPGHQPGGAGQDANQGEGNRTAAAAYDKDTTEFARSGKVEQAAKAAAADSPEQQAEGRRAEEAGKAHSHGEDPALKH